VLILVRHGQTVVNRDGGLQGRSDRPLTELGRAQATWAREALAGEGVERIVSSPLPRATETAEILTGLGPSVEVDERLVELDYGEWEGRALADVAAEEWAAWQRDPGFAPPGGESLRDVTARMTAFVADWVRSPRVTVAVSHVSPIKAACCLALGTDETASWRMHLDLASITRLAKRGDRAILASFNERPRPS
jgi:broad specificity phosphatase PhoE